MSKLFSDKFTLFWKAI